MEQERAHRAPFTINLPPTVSVDLQDACFVFVSPTDVNNVRFALNFTENESQTAHTHSATSCG